VPFNLSAKRLPSLAALLTILSISRVSWLMNASGMFKNICVLLILAFVGTCIRIIPLLVKHEALHASVAALQITLTSSDGSRYKTELSHRSFCDFSNFTDDFVNSLNAAILKPLLIKTICYVMVALYRLIG
jgi:hypothetical protein